MRAYEKELLSYNSNIGITKNQYLSDESFYEQRTRNGQQQAKRDIESGYGDGLNRYRLRCAHTFRDTNPFASSYMNEYNKERGWWYRDTRFNKETSRANVKKTWWLWYL